MISYSLCIFILAVLQAKEVLRLKSMHIFFFLKAIACLITGDIALSEHGIVTVLLYLMALFNCVSY